MSSWELWTSIAVAILVFGSVGVFGWFLVEVVSLARRGRSAGIEREGTAQREGPDRPNGDRFRG